MWQNFFEVRQYVSPYCWRVRCLTADWNGAAGSLANDQRYSSYSYAEKAAKKLFDELERRVERALLE